MERERRGRGWGVGGGSGGGWGGRGAERGTSCVSLSASASASLSPSLALALALLSLSPSPSLCLSLSLSLSPSLSFSPSLLLSLSPPFFSLSPLAFFRCRRTLPLSLSLLFPPRFPPLNFFLSVLSIQKRETPLNLLFFLPSRGPSLSRLLPSLLLAPSPPRLLVYYPFPAIIFLFTRPTRGASTLSLFSPLLSSRPPPPPRERSLLSPSPSYPREGPRRFILSSRSTTLETRTPPRGAQEGASRPFSLLLPPIPSLCGTSPHSFFT